MRHLLALAALFALAHAAAQTPGDSTSAVSTTVTTTATAATPAASAPAPAPAKVAAPPEPEADLDGLKVQPDIPRPQRSVPATSIYRYNSDGVNCSLYPTHCR